MTPHDLTVTISDTSDHISLAVGGELDMLTTSGLGVASDAAVEQTRPVVMDSPQ